MAGALLTAVAAAGHLLAPDLWVLVSLALTSTLPQRRPHGELTRKRLITAIGRVPSAEVDPGIVCAARKDSRNVRRANAGAHGQPGGSRRLVMCLYGEGG